MTRLARAVLRLYPAAWRDRYEAEMVDLVDHRPMRLRDLFDLAAGALDARLHPRLVRPAVAAASPSVLPPAQLLSAGVAPASVSPPFGAVTGPPAGDVTRRSFLRRMLGAGVGLLSLEFLGGTLAFLAPPPSDGIGVEHRVGTLDDIRGLWPAWDDGRPFEFRPARAFLVNVPAAKAWATDLPVTGTAVSASDLLALWRKCPHLGCMVPAACDNGRFQCLCHQSTYSIIGEKMQLGPAPRGMDRFPVRIDRDGTVVIDTREIVKGPPAGTITFRDARPPDVGCA